MDPEFQKTLAAQLRRPEGDFGRQVGQNMNEGNQLMNRHTLEALEPQPGDRILELGMGNGAFVGELLAMEPTLSYTGADFSPLMVEEATALNKPFLDQGRARFVLSDGRTLPFADHSFDRAFTVNTVYFWEDPAAMLAEFRRVLRPQGLLLVTIRPRSLMGQLPFTQHGFTMYEPGELEQLLSANGFQPLESILTQEPDRDFAGTVLPSAHAIVRALAG